MKLEFFGWLTKGHYEISMLDRLTFLAELLALFGVYFLGVFIWWNVNEWIKKRKGAKPK